MKSLERDFAIHQHRISIQDWPRDLLEMQYIHLLETYLAQNDTLASTAKTLEKANAIIEILKEERHG